MEEKMSKLKPITVKNVDVKSWIQFRINVARYYFFSASEAIRAFILWFASLDKNPTEAQAQVIQEIKEMVAKDEGKMERGYDYELE